MKRASLVLVLVMLMLVAVPVMRAQERIYQSESADFEFRYPSTWQTTANTGGNIILTNPDSTMTLIFMGADALSTYSVPDGDAADILQEILTQRNLEASIEPFESGDRLGALAQYRVDGHNSILLVMPFSNGESGLVEGVFDASRTLLDYQPEIGPILASFNSSQTVVLVHYGDDQQAVIQELESRGLIVSGGDLVFSENLVYFTGAGDHFTALARNTPGIDFVMAANLMFTPASATGYETCTVMGRVVMDNRGRAVDSFQIGFDSDHDLIFESDGVDVTYLNLDFTHPHHLLLIVRGTQLDAFLDGEQILNDASVTERSGIYGLALRANDRGARCEARDMWVYSLPAEDCRIYAAYPVNMREGAGLSFNVVGQLMPGEVMYPLAQSLSTDGALWWQVAETIWVNDAVVHHEGACESVNAK